MQKWETFTEEELQEFANQTHNQKEFCIKMGYAGKTDSAIKAIRMKYPNFTFPRRVAYNLEDLTGQTFNRLTVLEKDQTKVGKKAYWICKCECGNITSVYAYDLKNGKVKSCGCLRNERVRDAIGNKLQGQRFGSLTVLKQVDSILEPSGTLRTAWLCHCDCGKDVIVKTINLKAGDTQSCGCHSISHAELQIEKILQENNISFSKQFTFLDLVSNANSLLRFDFAIFNNKQELAYLLEYNGQQHYTPIEYFGGEEHFKKQQENDRKKIEYCNKNNIPLIIIKYTDKLNEETVIRKEFL